MTGRCLTVIPSISKYQAIPMTIMATLRKRCVSDGRTLHKNCLMTALVFVILSWLPTVFCGTSTTTATTTTTQPFFQSNMFIGLMAGVGGFLAFLILVCIVWKCTCGGK